MINDLPDALDRKNDICTPYYCFDADIFTDRVRLFREKLGGYAKLCYSLKANPWLLNSARKECDLIEVCSEGELNICNEAGIEAEHISVGGVSKSDEMCRSLAKRPPYRISVESIAQMKLLESYAEIYDSQLDVILRLTSGNQFGMPLEVIRSVMDDIVSYPHMRIHGIHYYPGTQKRGLKSAQRLINILTEAAKELRIHEIQFGAGFGADLFSEKNSDAFDAYTDLISDWVSRFSHSTDITVECGRYLTYQAGTYTTTILDIKEQCGRCFLIVDGGIHHLSYYGQIAGRPVPLIRKIPDGKDRDKRRCTVCGSLCTESDILAKDADIPDPHIGDRLVFMNAGAYSVTEARSLFLSRDLPSVIVTDSGEAVTMREACKIYKLNKR